MTNESKLRLDLNSPEFQRALFRLDKNGQRMVLNMLRKLLEMTWGRSIAIPDSGGKPFSRRVDLLDRGCFHFGLDEDFELWPLETATSFAYSRSIQTMNLHTNS